MVSAWSIPQSNRRSLSPVDPSNPGPGTYKRGDTDILGATSTNFGCIHFRRTNAAISIGKEKRKGIPMSMSPGIGTYNIQNQLQVQARRAPNYTFGVKNQFEKNIAYSPGPSDYKKEEYYQHNRFPAFSFASGREGGSSALSARNRQIKLLLDDSRLQQRLSSTAGFLIRDKKVDVAKFSKDLAAETDKSITMADKQGETQDTTNMGATLGSDPRSVQEIHSSQGTPKKLGERRQLFRNQLPSHSSRSRQVSPTGNRIPSLDLSNVRNKNKDGNSSLMEAASSSRGATESQRTQQSFWLQETISSKNNFLWKIADSPGPAFYEPNFNMIRSQAVTPVIGRTTRKFHSEMGTIEAPGPASYTPTPAKMEVKHSFPQAPRGASREAKSPGPADYMIRPMFADVPKYLLSKQ